MTPFCKVGGEEGLTEANGSATKRRKIFPNYSPPLQKGADAIGGGGIFLHRGEAAPSVSHWRMLVFAKKLQNIARRRYEYGYHETTH